MPPNVSCRDPEDIRCASYTQHDTTWPGTPRHAMLDRVLNQRLNRWRRNANGRGRIIDVDLDAKPVTEPQLFHFQVRADDFQLFTRRDAGTIILEEVAKDPGQVQDGTANSVRRTGNDAIERVQCIKQNMGVDRCPQRAEFRFRCEPLNGVGTKPLHLATMTAASRDSSRKSSLR